jgi:hypothetical protein
VGRKFLIVLSGVMLFMFWMALDMGLRWTPLQSHYFPAYISSVGLGGKGGYSFLFVRYPNGWRMALNEDVVIRPKIQQGVPTGLFGLSDHARRAGADALAWRFLPELDSATAVQWLREGSTTTEACGTLSPGRCLRILLL